MMGPTNDKKTTESGMQNLAALMRDEPRVKAAKKAKEIEDKEKLAQAQQIAKMKTNKPLFKAARLEEEAREKAEEKKAAKEAAEKKRAQKKASRNGPKMGFADYLNSHLADADPMPNSRRRLKG